MERQNTVLPPAAMEVINQISGTYSAKFWDGLLAVTESLDTVKSVKGAVEVLHNKKSDDVELAEQPMLSCIVRELTDDEATIIMVDSNLQRERVLPSEKAFAYRMKLDAIFTRHFMTLRVQRKITKSHRR